MGYLDATTGVRSGLDIAYCRAVAAAIGLNPDTGVEYIPASGSDRFDKLSSATIDVLIRTTTWTTSRDAELNADFAGMNFFDGQAILVRESAFPSADAGNSALGLSGANICVGVGTTTEGNMQDYFSSNMINFTSVGTADAAEATDKLISGECDAFAGDSYSTLAAKKATLDTDGSIDGGTWIISRYNLSEGSPGTVGSAISIVIPQSSNEMITGIEYLFTQVTLFATCIGNDTSCEDIIQILSYDVLSTNMETSCSNNVLFSWSATAQMNGQQPRFNGHGFDCTNTLNLHAINQIEGVDGYDSTSHELSWSDWAYSVIWESVPIEN